MHLHKEEQDVSRKSHHERLHRNLRVDGRGEVEHGGVGVLGDLPEDLVPRVGPHVHDAAVGGEGLLGEPLHHDPLDHEALEDEDGLQDAVERHLHEGVELRPVRPRHVERHVGEESADLEDEVVQGSRNEME